MLKRMVTKFAFTLNLYRYSTVLRRRLAALWRELPDDAPVLVLMSGIAGGSHDKYLKHFLRRAHRMGYRVAAFNCRGGALHVNQVDP
jgi:predicted alpha/beta-fold hydrolase